ncbi:MAG: hypothetical protein KC636_37590, partial [Myxococcales bacterium]|nr:hypothetical protein [Myxococcales bacterium]
ERALTSAVDALEEALFVLDANTTIGFANPKGKALTGWKEFEGPRRFVESVAPDDRERLRDAVRESLARHASETLRNVTLAASGARVTVRLEPIDDNSDACVLATVGSALDEPASAQRHDGSPRLMVYSHDTFGLGHIRRCMNLIRAMSERMEDLSTLLVTGSPVAHKFELPPRTDYLKLPAVRKVAPDAYEPRSLGMSDEGILTLRRNLLLRTVRDYSPNLLLVDHSPTGMNGELRPVLEYLRETGSCTRILGLRDIIDSPDRVAKRWAEEKMLDVLERDYDHMVVYGSRDVYATADEYGLPDALRARTTYANYVSQGVATKTVAPEVEERLVVVTIGGGDGGGDTLVRPFLQLLRDRKDELAIRAEVLLGPFAPPELRAELRALAEGSPVVLHDFIPDPTPLFARAGLVISTAGYNVSAELIAHAQRALLIPRVVHRDEQLIRSRRLAELGLVDFLHPADATPDAIGERVLAALANPARPLAEARAANRVPLDGAERMAEFVEGLARARR